jgi:hypothetical protein
LSIHRVIRQHSLGGGVFPADCLHHGYAVIGAGVRLPARSSPEFGLNPNTEPRLYGSCRHATELTAVFLDRNIAAILGHRRKTKISRQQREELAAVIHLCGTGPATAFARRGFRLMPGERCGDHDVAAYLAQIDAMKRRFLHLAAER